MVPWAGPPMSAIPLEGGGNPLLRAPRGGGRGGYGRAIRGRGAFSLSPFRPFAPLPPPALWDVYGPTHCVVAYAPAREAKKPQGGPRGRRKRGKRRVKEFALTRESPAKAPRQSLENPREPREDGHCRTWRLWRLWRLWHGACNSRGECGGTGETSDPTHSPRRREGTRPIGPHPKRRTES